MYTLDQPLSAVKGIGPALSQKLAQRQLETVKDLLLYLPLRYEDRSQRATIADLRANSDPDTFVTIKATLKKIANQYKGRGRSIQRASIVDDTGQLSVIWFNNRFVMNTLKPGQEYFFSGKLSDRGSLTQPKVEAIGEDTIHTDRLVPVYSVLSGLKVGTLRRILKHLLDNLSVDNELDHDLQTALNQLHFPDDPENVVSARQRLALEELLGLIHHSEHLKKEWQQQQGRAVEVNQEKHRQVVDSLPFELTVDQARAVEEILEDLQSDTPMNRLLIGDVGSGKTVVAGLAAYHALEHGHSVALVAPTQILAEQHFTTFHKLFTGLNVKKVMGKSRSGRFFTREKSPTLYIGTHAILNQLDNIDPALIIYDEQHRFGVNQRSVGQGSQTIPHTLTMSATPIPRSLMLTLFSHLQLSTITQMPPGRVPPKTWLVPESKRQNAFQWLAQQGRLTLVVCPFIDPSNSQALENVSAATATYDELQSAITQHRPDLKLGLLHGRLSQKAKAEVIDKLYNQEINILVTTPIVEVGIDLPTADVIVIEGAERFGLASLHQLRGRVGRAGQQAYCLLFTSKPSHHDKERLKVFTEETNGLQLAEFDMRHRGAGNIFGTTQHGFSDLKFANWANLELIAQARQRYEATKKQKGWQPFIRPVVRHDHLPAAN